MAEVVWTEPAVVDLNSIAEYIAVHDQKAAQELVTRVLKHVSQLAVHPESGGRPQELGSKSRYRHLVEPPCRIFYRYDGETVMIAHVMRAERLLRIRQLSR